RALTVVIDAHARGRRAAAVAVGVAVAAADRAVLAGADLGAHRAGAGRVGAAADRLGRVRAVEAFVALAHAATATGLAFARGVAGALALAGHAHAVRRRAARVAVGAAVAAADRLVHLD